MRVNVYAEEMSDRVEIVSKEIDGSRFTGVRFYLELPVTLPDGKQIKGPFLHQEGDDDSSAVTFWGKRSLLPLLTLATNLTRQHLERQGELKIQTMPDSPLGVSLWGVFLQNETRPLALFLDFAVASDFAKLYHYRIKQMKVSYTT